MGHFRFLVHQQDWVANNSAWPCIGPHLKKTGLIYPMSESFGLLRGIEIGVLSKWWD